MLGIREGEKPLLELAANHDIHYQIDYDLLHHLVALPFAVFSPSVISASIEAWTWLVAERAELEVPLMTEIENSMVVTIKRGSGLFSSSLKYFYSFVSKFALGLMIIFPAIVTHLCIP